MALRTKTIRVPVNAGTPADITSATLTLLGVTTIYIPENTASTVTFISASLFVSAQDTSTATGGSISAFSPAVTLGAAGSSTVTVATATLANTGENWGLLVGPIDYTSYFQTNFGSGVSQNASVSITITIATGTGTATRGVYAYFEITYRYDDVGNARIQTICIPYESRNTAMPTTSTLYATLKQLTGTNGILSGYTSPVIRHRWLEIKGNCNNNNTVTNHGISYGLDAAASIALPQRLSSLATDTWQLYQIWTSGLTSTATHTVNLLESLATRFHNIIINEWVNVEFLTGGTRTLNYIELPFELTSPIPGTTSDRFDTINRSFIIPESNPVMCAGAVEFNYSSAATAAPVFKAGLQSTYRGYSMIANVCGGQFSFQHGIDSTSQFGQALPLVRGENDLSLYVYASAGTITSATGIIKLLYWSDIESDGVDSHNHTIKPTIKPVNFTLSSDTYIVNTLIKIPESNYYINALSSEYHALINAGTMSMFTDIQFLTTDGSIGGWSNGNYDTYVSDTELSYLLWHGRYGGLVRQYPRQPDNDKFNVLSGRTMRNFFGTTTAYGAHYVCSYNSCAYDLTVQVSQSNGGTVTLELYRKNSSGDWVYFDTQTTVGDSTVVFTVYDPASLYYVSGYESEFFRGISKQDVPVGQLFRIFLSTPTITNTGYAGG